MQTLPPPSINVLKSLKLFSGIPDEELSKISEIMQNRVYESGEILISEDGLATQFFILVKGKLDVIKQGSTGQSEILNSIEESGELFGEMALVEDKRRSASILARNRVEVIVVPKQGFLDLVNHFPRFTLEVAKSISNYLRRTDATVIRSLEKKNEELARTIQELQETREALVKSERLSIIGKMASTIIHDIKSPMATIAGFAQLLGMQELPRSEVIHYTELIGRQVAQFNDLAQELLGFARGESTLDLHPVSFPDCLESHILAIQFNMAQRQMSLETDFDGKTMLKLDINRFGRVLENLARNAMDAMEAGGKLILRTRLQDADMILEVEDNGHGMSEQIQANIFDEFFTHSKVGGTGLGLAIVKSVVEDHAGEIAVSSQAGKGTLFRIKLPGLESQ